MSTGHTHTTSCTLCESTQWTNAQLSFRIEPYAMVLIVHGPDTLHIRFACNNKEELMSLAEALKQEVTQRIDVLVRTQRKVTECVYSHANVLGNRERCVVDAETMFWMSVCTLNDKERTLTLDHNRATTQIRMLATVWQGFDKTFPAVSSHMRRKAQPGVRVVAPNRSDEGQAWVIAEETSAAWGVTSPRLIDTEGNDILSGWQNGALVGLQQGQYWRESTLLVRVQDGDLQLELRRLSGYNEVFTVVISEKTRLLVQELPSGVYNVQVKNIPTQDNQLDIGTYLDVDDDLLTVTRRHATLLIALPSSALGHALDGLSSRAPCLCKVEPSCWDELRLWLWVNRHWFVYFWQWDFDGFIRRYVVPLLVVVVLLHLISLAII